jgi:hypothetical protein
VDANRRRPDCDTLRRGRVDVVDNYFGKKVPDPYRWLEELDSPEVRDWAAAQSAIALPFLRENNIRPWLLSRVDELKAFWKEQVEDSNERPLIDEQSLPAGQSISGVWASTDRKHAAYAVSTGGSEWVETRIRRLSDGKDLDERLDGLLWSNPSWTKDNRGFLYVRSMKPALRERTTMKGPVVYYHVLGTPQSSDVAILRTSPDVRDLVLDQELSADGRYLFTVELLTIGPLFMKWLYKDPITTPAAQGQYSFCTHCGTRVEPYSAYQEDGVKLFRLDKPLKLYLDIVGGKGCYWCRGCESLWRAPSRADTGNEQACGHFVPLYATYCAICGIRTTGDSTP